MSTINKKPFIKELLADLSAGQIATLETLIDGGGNQVPIKRTMNKVPAGDRTHITEADKGIHLCNLEANYSLFNGYLVYNDKYCVLIYFTDAQVLGMFNIDIRNLIKFDTIDEALSVTELRMELNDTHESEGAEIIEVVNEGIDDGSIHALKTSYIPFKSAWTTNGTIKQFCDDVNADADAVDGMVYLGELACSDLPTGLVNVDTVVEIINGSGTSNKVIHVICTSGNVFPYRWEYTYWNSGNNISGWINFGVDANPTVPSGAIVNSLTGIRTGEGYFSVPQGMQTVDMSGTHGTLSDEDFAKVSGNNCVVVAGGTSYFTKALETESVITYVANNISGEIGTRIIFKDDKAWISGTRRIVVANPTLSGTEQTLTGLQVGDIKYKVGGSGAGTQLYKHRIRLTDSSYSNYTQFDIISSHDSAYTYDEIASIVSKYNEDNQNIPEVINWHNSNSNFVLSRLYTTFSGSTIVVLSGYKWDSTNSVFAQETIQLSVLLADNFIAI